MPYTFADLSVIAPPFYATGINNQGEIVGYYDINGSGTGFLLNGAALTTFGIANPATALMVGDINNSGEIVGTTGNEIVGPNSYKAFTPIAGFITEGSLPGTTIPGFIARGINDAGTIAGSSFNDAGTATGSGIYQNGVITPLNDPVALPQHCGYGDKRCGNDRRLL
jgi:uncharacterized membrane protein